MNLSIFYCILSFKLLCRKLGIAKKYSFFWVKTFMNTVCRKVLATPGLINNYKDVSAIIKVILAPYSHSSPLRIVQITESPRHSNQSNSILTLLNYVQPW